MVLTYAVCGVDSRWILPSDVNTEHPPQLSYRLLMYGAGAGYRGETYGPLGMHRVVVRRCGGMSAYRKFEDYFLIGIGMCASCGVGR